MRFSNVILTILAGLLSAAGVGRAEQWIGRKYVGVVAKARLCFLAIVITCGAYIICGCDSKKDDRWIVIDGMVTEREHHLPVDSAWVVLIDSLRTPTYTDSLGRFHLMIIPYAQIDIFAGKKGYLSVHLVIETHGKDVSGILVELEKANQQNEGR